MDNRILDIFYNKILPEANSKNMVSIDGFLFDVSFVHPVKLKILIMKIFQ